MRLLGCINPGPSEAVPQAGEGYAPVVRRIGVFIKLRVIALAFLSAFSASSSLAKKENQFRTPNRRRGDYMEIALIGYYQIHLSITAMSEEFLHGHEDPKV